MTTLPFTISVDRNIRNYTFETSKYSYKVFIDRNDGNNKCHWFSFKAKKINDGDFFYDTDILTNDNIYLVMNTITSILKEEKTKYNTNQLCFSTRFDKKGIQRFNLYQRLLNKNNCTFEYNQYCDNSLIINL